MTEYPKSVVAKVWQKALICLMLTQALVLISACSEKDEPANGDSASPEVSPLVEKPAPQGFQNYLETGDLDALKARGLIRFLAPKKNNNGLPRQGLPYHAYRELAESFAEKHELQVQWIVKDSIAELIPALQAGEGDLIVSHITQTDTRAQQAAFSLALSHNRELIIGPGDSAQIEEFSQLNNGKILLPKGSSFVDTLSKIREQQALNFEISEYEGELDYDRQINLLNQGLYQATIMDDAIAHTLQTYRQDFSVGKALGPPKPIAWATRLSSRDLLKALNTFLTESFLGSSRERLSVEDFSEIQKRKTLRMITRNSPTSYFMWRGELMGFEYELLKDFADQHKIRLEVLVAPPEVNMIDWLIEGRGDVIASSMTVTPERQARAISFTRYYNKIHEQFVTSTDSAPINQLGDLQGRNLVINKNHAYWQTAMRLQNQQEKMGFELSASAKELSTMEILAGITRGEIDATLADSHLIELESTFSDALAPGLQLEPPREHAWAVREKNPELLSALNTYLNKKYRRLHFNVLYKKYFKNKRRINKYLGQRLDGSEGLSPYDQILKPIASQYQFDWRMVTAQMYQESKFNPKARSFAGARGLLQVMPRTAKELGYELPLGEESGIEAGIRYLNWTRERFEDELPLVERLWFALAAYNAGFGHVNDARHLAKQQGWNKDVWFGNVERAMLLLAKKEFYSKARFGYVRGREPVNYVRNIRERYHAYLAL